MRKLITIVLLIVSIDSYAGFCIFNGHVTTLEFTVEDANSLNICLLAGGVAETQLTTTEIDHLQSLIESAGDPNEPSLPTPEAIAESVGAGFVMMLPLMAVVWGGRQIISMFRTS